MHLASIGKPDLLWTVNILARSVTKWNKACGNTWRDRQATSTKRNITDNNVLLTTKVQDCKFFRPRLFFAHSDAKGNLTPYSSSHSIDHMPLDMVNPRSKRHTRVFLPCQTKHFRGQRSCHSNDHTSPILRHLSRPDRVDLDWSLERINLDSSISIRYVRTTEQLADMSTNGALTTIQWKSLVWLFDVHPPSSLNVDRSISESSCSSVALNTHLAMSQRA